MATAFVSGRSHPEELTEVKEGHIERKRDAIKAEEEKEKVVTEETEEELYLQQMMKRLGLPTSFNTSKKIKMEGGRTTTTNNNNKRREQRRGRRRQRGEGRKTLPVS